MEGVLRPGEVRRSAAFAPRQQRNGGKCLAAIGGKERRELPVLPQAGLLQGQLQPPGEIVQLPRECRHVGPPRSFCRKPFQLTLVIVQADEQPNQVARACQVLLFDPGKLLLYPLDRVPDTCHGQQQGQRPDQGDDEKLVLQGKPVEKIFHAESVSRVFHGINAATRLYRQKENLFKHCFEPAGRGQPVYAWT